MQVKSRKRRQFIQEQDDFEKMVLTKLLLSFDGTSCKFLSKFFLFVVQVSLWFKLQIP